MNTVSVKFAEPIEYRLFEEPFWNILNGESAEREYRARRQVEVMKRYDGEGHGSTYEGLNPYLVSADVELNLEKQKPVAVAARRIAAVFPDVVPVERYAMARCIKGDRDPFFRNLADLPIAIKGR